MQVHDVPRPKTLRMQPIAVPIAPQREVPPSPDSTRVIPLATGRYGVIFARGADGKRSPGVAVDTQLKAQQVVGRFRMAQKHLWDFVAWLASMLPRRATAAEIAAGPLARSGVRARDDEGGGR